MANKKNKGRTKTIPNSPSDEIGLTPASGARHHLYLNPLGTQQFFLNQVFDIFPRKLRSTYCKSRFSWKLLSFTKWIFGPATIGFYLTVTRKLLIGFFLHKITAQSGNLCNFSVNMKWKMAFENQSNLLDFPHSPASTVSNRILLLPVIKTW